MFVEPKDVALVEADAFEDAVALKKAVVEDRDFGVSFRIKFSVDIDFHRSVADVGGIKLLFPARSGKKSGNVQKRPTNLGYAGGQAKLS